MHSAVTKLSETVKGSQVHPQTSVLAFIRLPVGNARKQNRPTRTAKEIEKIITRPETGNSCLEYSVPILRFSCPLLVPRDILGGLHTGFSLPARRPGQYAYRHLRSKRANDSRPERVLPQTRRSEPDPLFPIPAAARIWGGLHAPRLSLGPSCRIEPSQWNTRICRPRRYRSGKCPLTSKPAEGLVQQPANQTCLGGWTEPDDQALRPVEQVFGVGNAHLGILATRAPEKIHRILPIDFGGDNCTRFRPFHIPLALVSRKDNPLPAPVDQIGRCGEKELGIFGRRTALYNVDGGGKRGQNSGGLVTFHSAPFPLGRGVLSERPAAVKGAPVLRGEANPSRRGPF